MLLIGFPNQRLIFMACELQPATSPTTLMRHIWQSPLGMDPTSAKSIVFSSVAHYQAENLCSVRSAKSKRIVVQCGRVLSSPRLPTHISSSVMQANTLSVSCPVHQSNVPVHLRSFNDAFKLIITMSIFGTCFLHSICKHMQPMAFVKLRS